MAERRKGQRHPRFLTRDILFFAFKGEVGNGFVRNVSEGGVFVETKTVLEPGSRLDVEMFLDMGDEVASIQSSAEVMWSSHKDGGKRNGMGLQFVDMDEETLEKLRAAIARLERHYLKT